MRCVIEASALCRRHLHQGLTEGNTIRVTKLTRSLKAEISPALFDVAVIHDHMGATAGAMPLIDRPDEREHLRHGRTSTGLIGIRHDRDGLAAGSSPGPP